MKDLTGEKFGRLTVIGFSHRKGKSYYWDCICNCGNKEVRKVQSGGLKNGSTKSCGCLNREIVTKHGLDGNKVYHVFNSMKSRCYAKSNTAYHNYGGKGVKICDEWLNDVEEFVGWAMSNGYKEGLTIERIDSNGDYCPENCKWATRKEQANNVSTNINIEYNGRTQTLSQWAEEYDIKMNTLYHRYVISKWDIERALITPVRTRKS